MKKGQWTEIFKAGNYGAKGTYTGSDLDKMVANFNSDDQVPIVVGHPETDSPAWGWLSGMKRDGDVLLGKTGDLHADFAEALSENKFKNRSVRITDTNSGPKILHLGYLGAVLPQVEGLKKTAHFAGDGECVDYAFDLPFSTQVKKKEEVTTPDKDGEMEKDAKIKKLEKDLADEKAARKQEKQTAAEALAAGRKASFSTFVGSKMIATGKLPKERKDEAVAFMMTLPAGESADFSWGDGDDQKGSSAQWFQDFVGDIAAPDFVHDLPAGEVKDFSRKAESGELVDLSHQV